MDKFTLKINNPAIPMIPGIFYLLLLLVHLLRHNAISQYKTVYVMYRDNFKRNPSVISTDRQHYYLDNLNSNSVYW